MMTKTLPNPRSVGRQRSGFWVFVTLILWVGSLSLVACRMPEPDTVATPAEPTPEPVAEVAAAPTATEEPAAPAAQAEPAAEPVPEVAAPADMDWTHHVTVSEEYYVLGNPDAPVLIVDVSDFL